MKEEPRRDAEATLALLIWAFQEIMPLLIVDKKLSFRENGGDSLSYISFARALTSRLGAHSRSALDLDTPLVDLAENLAGLDDSDVRNELSNAELDINNFGEVGLTANRLSYIARMVPHQHKWRTASGLYRIKTSVCFADIQAAGYSIQERHDGLRMRLLFDAQGKPKQILRPASDIVTRFTYDGSEDGYLQSVGEKADSLLGSVNTTDAPFRILAVNNRAREEWDVVFLIHHFLFDAISMDIIPSDFILLLESPEATASRRPGPSYASYYDAYMINNIRRRDVTKKHWIARDWREIRPFPYQKKEEEDSLLEIYTEELECWFDIETLMPSLRVLKQQGLSLAALVLAAIAGAWRIWAEQDFLLIGIAYHGRDLMPEFPEIDGLVGWLTDVVPAVISTKPTGFAALLAAQREILYLSEVGPSFSYLKYLDSDEETRTLFAEYPEPKISLNMRLNQDVSYAKRAGRISKSLLPFLRPPEGKRVFPVSGGAVLHKTGLRVSWDYSTKAIPSNNMAEFMALTRNQIDLFLSLVSSLQVDTIELGDR